ncbi:hypothetical protein PQU92_01390 [Asticcacaulis sp. BYS171W]|uniref:Uncharacterized protein n=1 Tax=Asticcacaulis aquaticus TaxID=2984212 RepID=A0ABT5HPC1_9CAUL|nr:hypothetical protein [Asticcacaulis aquaticus]MDC7681910.1 hypothetical protein [Asticcacaulis aquaticus]
MRYLVLALLGLLLSAQTALANEPICWIETAKKTFGGVQIALSADAPMLQIQRANGKAEMILSASEENGIKAPGAITLRVNDKITGSDRPHAYCTVTVIRHDGKLALKLFVYFYPPGPPELEPYTREEVFIVN